MNYHRVPIWFSPSMWNVLNVVLFGKMTPYYPYRCYCCKAGYLKKKHSVSQSSCKHAGHSQLSHTYRFISAVIGVLVWVWKMCRNSKANKNWSCHIHYYAKVSTRLLIEVFFFFFLTIFCWLFRNNNEDTDPMKYHIWNYSVKKPLVCCWSFSPAVRTLANHG